jgi:hypothetical protein
VQHRVSIASLRRNTNASRSIDLRITSVLRSWAHSAEQLRALIRTEYAPVSANSMNALQWGVHPKKWHLVGIVVLSGYLRFPALSIK